MTLVVILSVASLSALCAPCARDTAIHRDDRDDDRDEAGDNVGAVVRALAMTWYLHFHFATSFIKLEVRTSIFLRLKAALLTTDSQYVGHTFLQSMV